MYLIVNGTELTVNNAYTERDLIAETLTAVIEVPYYAMDFMQLKALFMKSTGIITKVNDDGSTESWDGFVYSKPPTDDGEQYRIVLVGNENTYQIERLRHMEKILAEKETKISSMETTLSEKDFAISEKESKIAEQEEMIAEKDTMITEQNSTIAEKETTITVQATTIETQVATIAELEQTIVSKNEEIATLAEQCADFLYMLALSEMKTSESEVK